MNTLLDASAFEEISKRIEQLPPETRGKWGKMDVAQMLAHLGNGLELTLGDKKPPRSWIGRIVGGFVKASAFNDSPFPHNSPTDNSLRVSDAKNFLAEKTRVIALLNRFNQVGLAGITAHPHPFFGFLTPKEWGKLQYKHFNYHLEQFGA
jgi:Protein of unknown function (DUF1569)